MTRKAALAAVAVALLLAAAGTALAGSGAAATPPAATGHGSHELPGGSRMQSPEMESDSHQMEGGSRMEGDAGMQHGANEGGTSDTADRPRALMLGGFTLANLLLLLAAAVVRHRDRRRPPRGSSVAGAAR